LRPLPLRLQAGSSMHGASAYETAAAAAVAAAGGPAAFVPSGSGWVLTLLLIVVICECSFMVQCACCCGHASLQLPSDQQPFHNLPAPLTAAAIITFLMV
jgi:hypothetical protein